MSGWDCLGGFVGREGLEGEVEKGRRAAPLVG